MLGFQVVAYENGSLEPEYRQPLADGIVKSWAATRDQAEREKERMEAEHPNAIVQIR